MIKCDEQMKNKEIKIEINKVIVKGKKEKGNFCFDNKLVMKIYKQAYKTYIVITIYMVDRYDV